MQAKTRSAKSSRKTRKKSRSSLSARTQIAIGGGVFILIIAVFIVLSSLTTTASAPNQPLKVDLTTVPDNSKSFPSLGGQHIDNGTSHAPYNSNPPTSGPHYVNPADLGVYTSGLPDETVVHNLEHGHIWLSYRDANDQDAIKLLTDLQQRNHAYVIVTYRPQDPTRVAAAAWTRLLTLDNLDADQLQAFILRYEDHAPESLPGN